MYNEKCIRKVWALHGIMFYFCSQAFTFFFFQRKLICKGYTEEIFFKESSINLNELFISEEKLKESGSHFSYKECLIKEMKELVDSFYRDVQIKICFIKKTQKREIRDMIKELKLMTLGEKSSKQQKKGLEESVCGNDTASTWTKEKQSDLLREIVQLSSSMKYVQEQSHQLKVPNSMGLGACNSRCSSSLGSTQHLLISSDCKSSAVDWKKEETESNA